MATKASKSKEEELLANNPELAALAALVPAAHVQILHEAKKIVVKYLAPGISAALPYGVTVNGEKYAVVAENINGLPHIQAPEAVVQPAVRYNYAHVAVECETLACSIRDAKACGRYTTQRTVSATPSLVGDRVLAHDISARLRHMGYRSWVDDYTVYVSWRRMPWLTQLFHDYTFHFFE